MWQVAFSSKSVSKKTRPVRPTRDSPSTSATSPSRTAPSSACTCSRITSAPEAASTAAALEADLEVADDGAADLQRPRRADDALGARRVGAREDLLGRHVGDVPD